MRINEDVLRYLTLRVDQLEEAPSPVMQSRGSREDRPRQRPRPLRRRSRPLRAAPKAASAIPERAVERPHRRAAGSGAAGNGTAGRSAAESRRPAERWRPKWKARRIGRRARGRRPPAIFPAAQILPVLRTQRAEDRLQGRPAVAALRLRARQDRAEPHHRGIDAEAARAGAGDQAGAVPRPAALHRELGEEPRRKPSPALPDGSAGNGGDRRRLRRRRRLSVPGADAWPRRAR